MRHQKKRNHLDRPADQRRALLRSLATEVLRRGSIETTLAKAKALRGVVDELITLGKRGDLHARRQVLTFIYDNKVVQHLFTNLATRYPERLGGYTRVIKTGFRRGDAAPMAVIQLTEGQEVPQKKAVGKAKAAVKTPKETKEKKAPKAATKAKAAASS